MNKILSYLKIIAEAWKGILAFVGIISLIAVIAVKIDHWKAQEGQTDKSLIDIKQTVTNQSTKLDSIYDRLGSITKRINRIDGTVGMVKTQLGNHIIKTSTDKQDILNWFNATEEKKNNSNNYLFWIPSDTISKNLTLR